MAPEYGATCGIFPVDAETLRYLALSGRPAALIRLVEAYCQGAGPVPHAPGRPRPTYSDTLELDLVDRRAEPGRPDAAAGPRAARTTPRRRSQTALKEHARRPPGQGQKPLPRWPAASSGSRPRAAAPRRRRRADAPQRPTATPPSTIDARLGRDRRDHELHQHVEPVGHARRRPAGQEGRRARALRPSPGSRRASRPGSKVVTDYLKRGRARRRTSSSSGSTWSATAARPASATPARCPPAISKAIHDDDLVAAAVLSGNRNFEGRINPEVRANYLASPPLVVAYALAGTMDIDLAERAARHRPAGQAGLSSRTSGRPSSEVQDTILQVGPLRDVPARSTARSSRATSTGTRCRCPQGDLYAWDEQSTYVKNPPYFVGHARRAAAGRRRSRRRACWRCSATASRPTTSRRPARSRRDGPAGKYLIEHGVAVADFNSYGVAARQPRGDGARHVRQRPPAEPARARAPRAA